MNDSINYDRRLHVAVSLTQLEALKAAAKSNGLRLSEYVRVLLFKALQDQRSL